MNTRPNSWQPLPKTDSLTIQATLAQMRKPLARAGIDAAALEARLLLGQVLGMDTVALIAHGDRAIDPEARARAFALTERRVAGQPIAYLLGQREFWSMPLQVNEHCLIPRPDTELLVALALERLPVGNPRVLDLGTGSGAIILALKRERPDLDAWGSDLSAQALAIAARNAQVLGLDVCWFQGRWLDGVRALPAFDLIVSNPPYIDPADPHLELGDLRFEPRAALVAPDHGLADLEAIAATARPRLRPGGHLLLEHGFDQAPAVRAMLDRQGFVEVRSHRDLAGHDRVTEGRSPDGAG
jgi:release factor glutamine methyltransferase